MHAQKLSENCRISMSSVLHGLTKKENTNERLFSSRFYYSPLFRVCPSRAFNQRGYTKDAYHLFAMINNLLFDKQTTF